jgi:hypothetical protein
MRQDVSENENLMRNIERTMEGLVETTTGGSWGIFGVSLSRLAEVRQVEAVIEPPRQYNLRSRAQESTDPFDLSELTASITAATISSVNTESGIRTDETFHWWVYKPWFTNPPMKHCRGVG